MSTIDELAEMARTEAESEEPKPAKTTRARKTKAAAKTETPEETVTTAQTAPTNGQDESSQNELLAEWDRGGETAPEDEPTSPIKTPRARVVRGTTTTRATASRRGRATQEPEPEETVDEPAPTVDDGPAAPVAVAAEPELDVFPVAAAVDEEHSPTFADLGLSEALLKSINAVGYEEPTPIQLKTIPVLLKGRDVIAQAQTGSGKTAAFGFPIIEAIDPQDKHVQALILAPTRELAIQVAEALHKYGRHKGVETLPIYGGQPYERQFRGLARGVQIVVGTPGRVMDHMRRGTLNLDFIRFFILDEADEMLDMGFIEDIEWILEQSPAERQTALFSATMPPRIADLATRYLHRPEHLTIAGKQMTVPETRQTSYEVPKARKVDALTRILDAETPPLAMIFCRTKLGVDELGEALLARGYQVETLHGDLSQAQRDRVMRRFRSGQADILIATDVAARGLDVPEVTHVINFDVPESAEAYVHRIGRTGRAGRSGEAITLVTPRETRWLRQIERIVKARIEPRRLPTASDVAERRREVLKLQVVEALKNQDAYNVYLQVVADLAEENDVSEIAAALLKLYADETGRGAPAEADVAADDIAAVTTPPPPRGEAGMTRLFLNLGRNLSIRPQDIVGAIANEADIPGRSIGAIDIYDSYTFVDVPTEFAERVIEAVQASGIKGRTVNAEIAQPGQGRGRDGGRDGGFRGGPPPRQFDRGGPPRQFDRGGPPRQFDRDQPPRDGGNFRRDFDRNAPPPRQFDRGGPPPRRFDHDNEPNGNVRNDQPTFTRDRPPTNTYGNRRDEGPRRYDRGNRGPGNRRDY
jgi:ATP-dependent RNA helicase DeaD